MKKPSFGPTIVIHVILAMMYFVWVTFFQQTPDGTMALYGTIFFAILLYSFFQKWKTYKKEMETFIQMITIMGKREKIIDYEIKKLQHNGSVSYMLVAEVDAFGEKKKFRKNISKKQGETLLKSKQALDLYYDATNSSKFVYYLKLPELI